MPASTWKVFGRIPECAVVGRVNRHAAVVGPVPGIALRTMCNSRRGQYIDLTFHRTQRISGQPTCVANGGTHRAAGDVVTDSDITRFVHGKATLPAII